MTKDQVTPEIEPRFSQEQYDFLKQCSEKGAEGIEKWNRWRQENPEREVLLEAADLRGWYLARADLRKAKLRTANLDEANLDRAHLDRASLKGASVRCAYLRAYLPGAKLWSADLEGADLYRAHLEDADFYEANLRSANFAVAQVDGRTLFARCKVDRDTDFAGVALGNACAEPDLKQLLEYNVRRIGWTRWDEGRAHRLAHVSTSAARRAPTHRSRRAGCRQRPNWALRWFVSFFWSVSDYGQSTRRIIAWFFGLAFAFALAYWRWPGWLTGLKGGHDLRSFVHATYFSVVTMTTLGFGDIAANPESWQGQALLMAQVLFGYVLLGALVTRFAVLFTAGGPAGQFSRSGPDEPD